jgi:hypothetical protein
LLISDIVGIATVSRSEHHARQHLPPEGRRTWPAPPGLVEPAEVIDAELVDPDAEGDPDIGPNSSADS